MRNDHGLTCTVHGLAALALYAAVLLPTLGAVGTLTATQAHAQAPEWPTAKPISYVVPFTAGGSTDIIGRTIANKLQESLKQAVVVENKPGQAGGIGVVIGQPGARRVGRHEAGDLR